MSGKGGGTLHNLQSQTPTEQAELVQYEANLAACYEAEYLLSMKLQEEFYGSSGGEIGGMAAQYANNDFYCDSYEVVWVPRIDPAHLKMDCIKADSVSFSPNLSAPSLDSSSEARASGVNATTPILISEEKSQVQRGLEDMDCMSGECNSSLNHGHNGWNGISSDNHVEIEGPSRKRIRLQNTD